LSVFRNYLTTMILIRHRDNLDLLPRSTQFSFKTRAAGDGTHMALGWSFAYIKRELDVSGVSPLNLTREMWIFISPIRCGSRNG
jgi:hypothetical protein